MKVSASSITPRKQPRQARSVALVEALLETAARILEVEGLSGFNTNVLAQRAGVSIGSLYQYFPSKEALLVELIRRKRLNLVQALWDSVARRAESDAAGLADGLVRAGLSPWRQRPALARALAQAERVLPLHAETEALKQQIIDLVAQALSRHGIATPGTVARDLVAITHGMADNLGLFGDENAAVLEQRIRDTVRGYLDLPPEDGMAADAT